MIADVLYQFHCGQIGGLSKQVIVNDDCMKVLEHLPDALVDVVVTSPPYNLSVDYNTYDDNTDEESYLNWTYEWCREVCRVLKDNGSFFLNISGSPTKPYLPFEVVGLLRRIFTLQNQIIWVKSVYIPDAGEDGHTFGHFKPINSERFLNNTHEFVFHFTKTGKVKLDRLSIGVPYSDQSNTTRWKSKKNKRCQGNVWYIPYETKNVKDAHPAMFPVEIPLRCINLHGIERCEVVLDPFSGMGTTLLACRQLSLYGVGIEMDESYFESSLLRVLSYG